MTFSQKLAEIRSRVTARGIDPERLIVGLDELARLHDGEVTAAKNAAAGAGLALAEAALGMRRCDGD